MRRTLIDAGWNLGMIQSAGDHKVSFEDTRNRGAFPGYSRFAVPWGGYIYPGFDLNQRFEKTDALVSLAKLKQHATAGITGAVKNFFGNTPSSIYGDDGPGEHALKHRAAMFHAGRGKPPAGAPQELSHGLPNRGPSACRGLRLTSSGPPRDLNIVEGIRQHQRRRRSLERRHRPGRTEAPDRGPQRGVHRCGVHGRDGFDPRAEHGRFPFQGDNHLQLLAAAGVGTNDPQRIEVRGLPLATGRFSVSARSSASGIGRADTLCQNGDNLLLTGVMIRVAALSPRGWICVRTSSGSIFDAALLDFQNANRPLSNRLAQVLRIQRQNFCHLEARQGGSVRFRSPVR